MGDERVVTALCPDHPTKHSRPAKIPENKRWVVRLTAEQVGHTDLLLRNLLIQTEQSGARRDHGASIHMHLHVQLCDDNNTLLDEM